jgi:glutaredoxin
MNRLKSSLPLWVFIAGVLLIPNSWRIGLWLNPVATKAQQVTLYSTSWCSYCAKARSYFQQAGVAVIEQDIERSAAAHHRFKQLGGSGVPLIVIDDKVLHGFNPSDIRRALEHSSP